MSWVDLLSDVQKDEVRTLKNFRDHAVTQVGHAHIETVRTRATLALAEQNLRTAERAVFELNDRIAKRVREFLADSPVTSVNIDDLV